MHSAAERWEDSESERAGHSGAAPQRIDSNDVVDDIKRLEGNVKKFE